MFVRKCFKEYKQEIYAVIVIVVAVLAKQEVIPLWMNARIALALLTIGVIGLGILFEFVPGRIALRQGSTSDTLLELEKDLSLHRTRSIVIFRNAPLDDLFPFGDAKAHLTQAIRNMDWWDWSYIGPHPDCNGLCAETIKDIKDVYLGEEAVQTSSLAILEDYPLGQESVIFTGDLLTPKNRNGDIPFPKHVWTAVIQDLCELYFVKAYVIRTAWRADKNKCTVQDAYVIRDPRDINKKWNKVHTMIREQATSIEPLVIGFEPEEKTVRQRFFSKIQNRIFSSCDSLFVISPESGHLFRVTKALRNCTKPAVICFVIGWLLSPFSFYNDIIVNVPLSLFLARCAMSISGINHPSMYGLAYLFTNVLGVLLVFFGLHLAKKDSRRGRLSLGKTALNLFIFTIVSMVVGSLIFK